MTAVPFGSTGPCSAPASAWPFPESCSSASAGCSAPTGSAGKSTSISAVEGVSQDRSDDRAVRAYDAGHAERNERSPFADRQEVPRRFTVGRGHLGPPSLLGQA